MKRSEMFLWFMAAAMSSGTTSTGMLGMHVCAQQADSAIAEYEKRFGSVEDDRIDSAKPSGSA